MEKIQLSKTFGVYQIKNLVDSKIYVGSTSKSFTIRWKQWHYDLKRGKANKHIQNAWIKYGPENFEFSILEVCTNKEDCIPREQHYIDTLQPEYNFMKIAGAYRDGTPTTEESKAKMCGRTPWNKGIPMTDEIKSKVSENRKGKGCGEANHNYQREFTPEHRKKISEAQFKFSREQEEVIYQDYIAGLSTTKLGVKYGANYETIRLLLLRKLEENGNEVKSLRDAQKKGIVKIPIFNSTKKEHLYTFTNEEAENLLNLYLNGKMPKELSQKFNTSTHRINLTILRVMKQKGYRGKRIKEGKTFFSST